MVNDIYIANTCTIKQTKGIQALMLVFVFPSLG